MNKCPPWSSDGPETRDGSFRQSCANAYQAVQKNASKKIADAADCCGWHKIMFELQVPLDYYAGNFRQIDPSRPCLQINVQVGGIAGFTPDCVLAQVNTMFLNLRAELAKLESDWHKLSPDDRAKRLAIILGYLIGRFIQIHPFINGNGRTSRLLWAWGLLRFGVSPQVRVRQHPEHTSYNFVMAKAMQGDFNYLSLFILTHLTENTPRTPTPMN